MPRTQTVHLGKGQCHDESEVWCEGPGNWAPAPYEMEIDKCTCEACLKAAAEYGRQALCRGFEIGCFELKEAK